MSIGNFDGVHLGHQALLSRMKEKAALLKLPSVVILFEPQPVEFFQMDKAPARINSLREKLRELKALGIDWVLCLKFNEKQAMLSAETFIYEILKKKLKCRYLLVGMDFRFGSQRKGDIRLIQQLMPECQSESFADFLLEGQRVSSTAVRNFLAKGLLEDAARLLGRIFSMCGRVLHGDGRGKKWGIPTANLAVRDQKLPVHGVFCVKVRVGHTFFNGVANIGCRPSVDGRKNVLEVHLLNFNQDLYGQILDVFFLKKLRDEVKFTSIDDLIRQIKADIKNAEDYFAINIVN